MHTIFLLAKRPPPAALASRHLTDLGGTGLDASWQEVLRANRSFALRSRYQWARLALLLGAARAVRGRPGDVLGAPSVLPLIPVCLSMVDDELAVQVARDRK